MGCYLLQLGFPISRDPPEGGTELMVGPNRRLSGCFQFLGIPPKGEHATPRKRAEKIIEFPISRDPPEGGTRGWNRIGKPSEVFPISRDPPEGGTCRLVIVDPKHVSVRFQFLGIPPKGELFWEDVLQSLQ